jgi:hypothetical protein
MTPIFLFSQDTVNHKTIFPRGITFDVGVTFEGLVDEYISKEKYSGTIPYYCIQWAWYHQKMGYRLGFETNGSAELKNNDIVAEFNQANFYFDFIYPVANFRLFSKSVFAYLGPGVNYYDYYISHDFASYTRSYSDGGIFSFGINFDLIYPVKSWFHTDLFLRSGLLAVASKSFDPDKYSGSDTRFTSVFNATSLNSGLSFRFNVLKKLTLTAGYKFQFNSITIWDDFKSASDVLFASINIKIK